MYVQPYIPSFKDTKSFQSFLWVLEVDEGLIIEKKKKGTIVVDRVERSAMLEDNKKMKVKKGFVAVQVGLEDEDEAVQRFVIPISYLYHPLFRRQLDEAHEVYGYHTNGPLRFPCSVDDFLHLRWRIEKEPSGGSVHHHHHHHSRHHHPHLSSSLSFHSCW